MIKRTMSVTVFFLLCLSLSVFAGERRVELHLSSDETVPGRHVLLKVIVHGFEPEISPPEIPFADGLDVRYTHQEKDEQDRSILVYRVVPMRAGSFEIGPVFLEHEGDVYRTNSLELIADRHAGTDFHRREEVDYREKGLDGRIFLEVDLPERDIYVNDQFSLRLFFYSDWLDVEQIAITEPPHRHFITGEYVLEGTEFIDKDGQIFFVMEYSRDMFATEPGVYEIGPMKAAFTVTERKGELLNDNQAFYEYFLGPDKSRRLEIETDRFEVRVLPFPREGMPGGFMGAVGDFEMTVQSTGMDLSLGEEFEIRTVITGSGNISSINAPRIEQHEGLSVSPPVIRSTERGIESSHRLKVRALRQTYSPEVSFSYFDPGRGNYVHLRERIKGLRGITEEGEQVVEEDEVSLAVEDIVPIKLTPGPFFKGELLFYETGWFFVFYFSPILFLSVLGVVRKKERFLQGGTPLAKRYRARRKAEENLRSLEAFLIKEDSMRFYEQLHKTLCEYLGMRFSLSPRTLSPGDVEKRIVPFLDEKELADIIYELFADLYLMRYAGENVRSDMERSFDRIVFLIKRFSEEKKT